jgi:dipeptidyl aminopeptidase/acylaminoacyl peptidase
VYRANGAGYIDSKRPAHIWVVAVPSAPGEAPMPKPQLLTNGPYTEGAPIWSADGSQLYFTSSRTLEPYYEVPSDSIFSVPANGGEVTKVISIPNGDVGAVALSPDGKQFAFRGVVNKPVQSYTQNDLWVSGVSPGSAPKNLTANFDYDIGSGVGGDQAPPRGGGGSRPLWSGNSIIDLVGKQGTANLNRFDPQSGKLSAVTDGKQDVVSFSASKDGSKLALLISTPTKIGDLYVADSGGSFPKQLTNFNDKLFSQLNLTEPEEIWYTSFDGKKIQTWVQKPPDFDPAKKYPLILDIHGGPHSAYGYTFDHEFQWMAAKGYVVLYPNPRGSTTYGQDFGNIIQYHYPGDDFKDLMAGVDEVIKRGYIDAKHMGVTGGSGGGVLTNWTIGHTDRFAAAVSQRSISDWADFWYTADFTLFQPSWFRGAPWQDPADFKARSPITYIEQIHTPLMLIEGEADYRTPPTSGGEQLFRALKFLKRPVVMVRFPEESHELSRSGKPWHRVERLENIVNWFDIYLQGKKIPGYEIAPGVEMQTGAEE